MAPVPDPNQSELTGQDEQLSYQAGPQVIQVDSETDSDSDGDDVNGGYLPLAQGPDYAQLDDSDTDESEDGASPSDQTNLSNKQKTIPAMPEDQANKIKAVMATIKIPSIPQWAEKVPEDQWMSSLINNLKKRQERTTPNHKEYPTTSGTVDNTKTDNDLQSSNEQFDVNFEAHFPS